MPFCPKCLEEYREGFNICADCGRALVEEKPAERPEQPPVLAFLVHAGTLEADGLVSLLASFGIPSERRVSGEGDISRIYTGISAFGEDVFVPAPLLERAREIIAARSDIPADVESMENPELDQYTPPDENYEKTRQAIGLFLTLVWVIPIAIYFFTRVWGNIKGVLNG